MLSCLTPGSHWLGAITPSANDPTPRRNDAERLHARRAAPLPEDRDIVLKAPHPDEEFRLPNECLLEERAWICDRRVKRVHLDVAKPCGLCALPRAAGA